MLEYNTRQFQVRHSPLLFSSLTTEEFHGEKLYTYLPNLTQDGVT